MKANRKEIMPSVWLTCINTDKFKTGCLSVSLLTALNRENAADNAATPRVLRRGTAFHPDIESLGLALDELYGARIEPVARKKGEIQAIGFFCDFPDDAWLPKGESLLTKTASLMGEILLSPNTRGGLLLSQYVDSEREKLLEQIRSRINEKRSYSIQRLFELMCFSEDYAVTQLGGEDEAGRISYTKLTRHYKQLLQCSPIEIFYCGSSDPISVERAMLDALCTLPRGNINLDIGSQIRLNALEENPRYFTEELSVTQGKLAIGFRLGACMNEPDHAAIRVLNAVYGGSVTSKLFMNVREKLSLCYYASSMIDLHKGLLAVSSGIEFDKYDSALSEIFAQLEAVKNGDISEYEMTSAKNYISTALKAAMDSPGALEDFYLSQNIFGTDYGPSELASMAEAVTKEQIIGIAQGIECDAVYFLRGEAGVNEE